MDYFPGPAVECVGSVADSILFLILQRAPKRCAKQSFISYLGSRTGHAKSRPITASSEDTNWLGTLAQEKRTRVMDIGPLFRVARALDLAYDASLKSGARVLPHAHRPNRY